MKQNDESDMVQNPTKKRDGFVNPKLACPFFYPTATIMDPQPWSKAQPHRILRQSGAANSATTSRSGAAAFRALSPQPSPWKRDQKTWMASGLLRSVSQLQVDLVTI